jgi:phosphoesterase RecJ-like protein
MRSKGAVDIGRIAAAHGGGGHRNAAACALTGPLADVQARVMRALEQAVADAGVEP